MLLEFDFNFCSHRNGEHTSSAAEQPLCCNTTTPLHQSSESSLVRWPALKSEGKCVESLAEHLPHPNAFFDVTECA